MTTQEKINDALTRLEELKKEFESFATKSEVLEVGKWYKYGTALLNYQGVKGLRNIIQAYGLVDDGDVWIDVENCGDTPEQWILATSQEVEEALIKEAKRRGVIQGVTVLDQYGNTFKNINGTYVYRDNKLAYGGCIIFKNGKWAEVIEVDKFADLKAAHKNGAVIQYWNKTFEKWHDVFHNNPYWCNSDEYRIKPEENPKIGDVCKFWVNKYHENEYFIGVLDRIDDKGDYIVKFQQSYKTSVYTFRARYAKPLTQQEVIDLLFNKK